MTRRSVLFALLLLLPFVTGCGALRTFKSSFGGRPENARQLVAPPKTNRSMSGVLVRVFVYDDDWSGRCVVDVDNSVSCDFGIERLFQDAKFTGGWVVLNIWDARALCDRAMFSALGSRGQAWPASDDVDACALGLLELRTRELAPPPRGVVR